MLAILVRLYLNLISICKLTGCGWPESYELNLFNLGRFSKNLFQLRKEVLHTLS